MDYESTLNGNQKKILKDFLKTRTRPDIYLEEDCCGVRDYYFKIVPSSIGDCIYAVCGKEEVWLDDGLDP